MIQRSKLVTTAGLAVAGLVAVVVAVPNATAGTTPLAGAPAAAPAAKGAAALDPALVAAVARDLRLDPEQARARLVAEQRANRARGALRDALGAAYGGSWISTTGQLNVAVTTASAATLARQAGATPKIVRHSEAALAAIQSKLDARSARAPKAVTSWYVDVAANTVVVLVKPGRRAAARAFVGRVGGAAVRYQTSTETPRPFIDVVGGNAYYIGSGTRCSVGFSVNGGFVTAGHCGQTGSSTSQPSGSFAGSSFPGNDYAWVRVSAGNTPRGLVNGYGNGNVAVAGSQEAAVGSTVCRSGSTTGWHCGRINARNASVTYPQGTVNGLIRTSVCAEPGDSGGSLVAGNQAQGVTSGGSGNCSFGGTTFFQPVNEILQRYGLTLVTSGTPPSPTATPTSQPPGGTTWAPWTAYTVGDIVTYNGQSYRCRQSHTSLPGWDPPIVLALWLPI